MISITRDGTKVRVNINSVIPYEKERIFYFTWECATEWWAGLLTKNINDSLWEALKTARREAYEAGWRAAKAKTRKEDWFSGRL